MKTILVLTDFSINATYTAQYALHLAQKIEANLLLCNIYDDPHGKPADSSTSPLKSAEEDSINDLVALAALLKKQLDSPENQGKFRPEINQCSEKGLSQHTLNGLVKKHAITFGAISEHNNVGVSSFFATNHARAIIEKANFPLLIVPYQARFKPYQAIAFATAMNYSDIDVLQSLTGLAGHSGSEILITRVIPDKGENELTVKEFFNQIPSKIAYPRIRYQAIKNRSVIAGLRWLTAHKEIDLLVLVHRKQNFLRKLFNGSIVQRLALRTGIPLLIFPCVTARETLPVF